MVDMQMAVVEKNKMMIMMKGKLKCTIVESRSETIVPLFSQRICLDRFGHNLFFLLFSQYSNLFGGLFGVFKEKRKREREILTEPNQMRKEKEKEKMVVMI